MEDERMRQEITRFVAQVCGMSLAYLGLGYSAVQFFGQRGWFVAMFFLCLFYLITSYYKEDS
jgi:hypothetical protein